MCNKAHKYIFRIAYSVIVHMQFFIYFWLWEQLLIIVQYVLLQFCPVWVAPNLLTFSGFLLTILNFFLFSYYDFGFHALTKENITNDEIPSWVWAVTAVNLFVAYTLGKRYFNTILYTKCYRLLTVTFSAWYLYLITFVLYYKYKKSKDATILLLQQNLFIYYF